MGIWGGESCNSVREKGLEIFSGNDAVFFESLVLSTGTINVNEGQMILC